MVLCWPHSVRTLPVKDGNFTRGELKKELSRFRFLGTFISYSGNFSEGNQS